MKIIDYPIIMKDVLSVQDFITLHDEFKYTGWNLNNKAYTDGKKEDDRLGWQSNQRLNNLHVFKCGSIIKLKLKKILKQDLILIRCHSNGQTTGQTSKFHIDYNADNIWTVILFLCKDWNTEYGGEFTVHNHHTNEYKYVPYIPNTAALIPSNWYHKGSDPNVTCDKLRMTAAFSYSSIESFDTVKHLKGVQRFL